MRKNIIALSCVFLMVFIVLMLISMPSVALAAPRSSVNSDLQITAKAAYLADYDTGTVIYEKNADAKLPIASMVKIMTSLLTFEAVDSGKVTLDNLVTVSENASGMGGSQVFLDANTQHPLGSLLKTVIVASANDSSVAIAEFLGGSESSFVSMMNKRAAELGMKNTHFANCTGLPAPENFSCARDVAIMTKELVKHPQYFKYSHVWLEDYEHPDGRKTTITNTNKLIRFYKGCDGGKTGFTNEAMFCVSATAVRHGMRVMAVVIGAENSKVRFAEASNMMNYAFGNYENKVLLKKGEPIENAVEVIRGRQSAAVIVAPQNVCSFMKRGEESACELKYELPASLRAPMKAGDVVGKIIVIKNNKVIAEIPAVLGEDLEKATYGDDIKRILRDW